MGLKLVGHAASTCSQRVLMALEEKNIPYELHNIDFSVGEHKSAGYLEKQPFGVIPYLDDDGFILFESRAIVRYLEAKYKGQGTELLPTELKALGLAEQGAYIESENFAKPAGALIKETVFAKSCPPLSIGVNGRFHNPSHVPDEATVTSLREQLTKVFTIYDGILGKQKFIGGDTFTIGDVYHLSYLHLLKKTGEDKLWESHPNVDRWAKDVLGRPAWVKVSSISF